MKSFSLQMITSRNFTSVGRSHNRNQKPRPPSSASRLFDSRAGTVPERSSIQALSVGTLKWSPPMTKSGILATVAILASALASPALAQEVIYNPGYCAQYYPNANCQNRGPGSPYTGSYQRQIYQDQAYRDRTWQNSYNRTDDNSGFWPADVAAGVVGGAVGTAAAIAAHPLGGGGYAPRHGLRRGPRP